MTDKTIFFVAGLPRNAVGKVVRRDMPAFVGSLAEQEDVESL